MKVVITLDELQAARSALPEPVGFVPTMGFLHAGHISLVDTARRECASVVVSLFVNPTQFAPHEDLSTYPRNLARDYEMLDNAGVAVLWTPTPEVMYPTGYQTWVEVTELTKPLEGSMRPGHFRGVTTVVAKLFNAVRPSRAYFGQKDAQQAAVIRQMTRDLSYPIEIVIGPTVREPDGLALSSRNTYLNPAERQAALTLSHSLQLARELFAAGERSASVIRSEMQQIFDAEPLAKVQYISIADPGTLLELEQITGRALVSLAVHVGKTRLIDNAFLES